MFACACGVRATSSTGSTSARRAVSEAPAAKQVVAAEPEPAATSCNRNAAGAEICSYDYAWHGQHVEAIIVKPHSEAPVPGLMLLPGTGHPAREFQHMAEAFARSGFASLAISLPGYGQTQVEPDFVGPNTLDMLQSGFEHFQREPFVDARKLGILGYSRGAMAASLLVLRMPGVRAAVFGGGVYDLAKMYTDVEVPGRRSQIEMEIDVTEAALRERSSLPQMEKLQCPVLIVHGELDERVPVSQAYSLRDRLQELGKEYELKIIPGQGHLLSPPDFAGNALKFFESKLLAR
jgi:dipeptidyl aminopeptidase/acylaminoacyl peptidase